MQYSSSAESLPLLLFLEFRVRFIAKQLLLVERLPGWHKRRAKNTCYYRLLCRFYDDTRASIERLRHRVEIQSSQLGIRQSLSLVARVKSSREWRSILVRDPVLRARYK
jgi:hypothetical protein